MAVDLVDAPTHGAAPSVQALTLLELARLLRAAGAAGILFQVHHQVDLTLRLQVHLSAGNPEQLVTVVGII